jgi:hypothetical protein
MAVPSISLEIACDSLTNTRWKWANDSGGNYAMRFNLFTDRLNGCSSQVGRFGQQPSQ